MSETQSMTTIVFAPTGPVSRDAIISQAINNVRDLLPPVLDLKAKLVDGVKGERGTDFHVKITYTERGVVDGAKQRAKLNPPTEYSFTPGTDGELVADADAQGGGDDAATNPAIAEALARVAPVNAAELIAQRDDDTE